MQVVVKQTSGLGNQLFQYAAGTYLAEKYGAHLRIAAQRTSLQRSRGFPRPVLLQKYRITADIAPASLTDRLVLSTRRDLSLLSSAAKAMVGAQVIRESPGEQFRHRGIAIDKPARAAYLQGYWQSSEIVAAVEPALREQLVLVAPPERRNRELAERIMSTPNSASLHLRRGDYVAVFGSSVLLPLSYYESAIAHLRERCGSVTYFVFSDDQSFAEQWASNIPGAVVVGHNGAADAHEDLRLMSLCNNHIIANSSFSWWGAWLNARPEKKVLMPGSWLGHRTRELNIIPCGWTVIDF